MFKLIFVIVLIMSIEKISAKIKQSFYVPVIRGRGGLHTLQLIDAIVQAGLQLIELTFSTPDWANMVMEVKKKYPEMVIGAGTVLTLDQCKIAKACRVDFIVSPGFDPMIAKWSILNHMLYLPGVMTPSDIMMAKKSKLSYLKLFPSQFIGPSFIKAMFGPFPDVYFLPTGGIGLSQISQWLIPQVFAIGLGSEFLKPAENNNFAQVTNNIREAIKIREVKK